MARTRAGTYGPSSSFSEVVERSIRHATLQRVPLTNDEDERRRPASARRCCRIGPHQLSTAGSQMMKSQPLGLSYSLSRVIGR